MTTITNRVRRVVVGLAALAISVGGSDALPLSPFEDEAATPKPPFDSLSEASLPQLRSILASPDSPMRWEAASALLKANDVATILRLVYALKQGSNLAEDILHSNASILLVPYLLEDVAHGSFGSLGEPTRRFARVRLAATEIVAKALAQTDGFTDETNAWLKSLSNDGGLPVQHLAEKSKFLIDWWVHNQGAVLAGRLQNATWLPAERKLTSKTFDDAQRAIAARTPPPPPPPPPLPVNLSPLLLEVREPFKKWASRVMHPEQLNLSYTPIDFEAKETFVALAPPIGISAAGVLDDSKKVWREPDHQYESPPTLPVHSIMPGELDSTWIAWAVIIVSAFGLFCLGLKKRNR